MTQTTPAAPNTAHAALAAGVAPPGVCTADAKAGFLAWYEIKSLLASSGTRPIIDNTAMAAYASYGPNKEHWVSFDTDETLHRKVGCC